MPRSFLTVVITALTPTIAIAGTETTVEWVHSADQYGVYTHPIDGVADRGVAAIVGAEDGSMAMEVLCSTGGELRVTFDIDPALLNADDISAVTISSGAGVATFDLFPVSFVPGKTTLMSGPDFLRQSPRQSNAMIRALLADSTPVVSFEQAY